MVPKEGCSLRISHFEYNIVTWTYYLFGFLLIWIHIWMWIILFFMPCFEGVHKDPSSIYKRRDIHPLKRRFGSKYKWFYPHGINVFTSLNFFALSLSPYLYYIKAIAIRSTLFWKNYEFVILLVKPHSCSQLRHSWNKTLVVVVVVVII